MPTRRSPAAASLPTPSATPAAIDRSGREPLVVIKPSGVDYASLTPADLVVTDLDGKIVEGSLNPSSDLDTHTLLYREFPQIGGIVHTHSEFATSWAQAGRAIPCLGTTHADYFHGPVPVTEPLTAAEVAEAYVRNTGAVIVRRFRAQNLDPIAVPGVLVAGHAPFTWGKNPPRPSNTPMSSNTLPALPSAAPSWALRNLESPPTFLSIITCANTAPKPRTVRDSLRHPGPQLAVPANGDSRSLQGSISKPSPARSRPSDLNCLCSGHQSPLIRH